MSGYVALCSFWISSFYLAQQTTKTAGGACSAAARSGSRPTCSKKGESQLLRGDASLETNTRAWIYLAASKLVLALHVEALKSSMPLLTSFRNVL